MPDLEGIGPCKQNAFTIAVPARQPVLIHRLAGGSAPFPFPGVDHLIEAEPVVRLLVRTAQQAYAGFAEQLAGGHSFKVHRHKFFRQAAHAVVPERVLVREPFVGPDIAVLHNAAENAGMVEAGSLVVFAYFAKLHPEPLFL